MTRGELIQAIEAAAASRVARLFDVLCSEIAQDENGALDRFNNGVASLNEAQRLASEGEGT